MIKLNQMTFIKMKKTILIVMLLLQGCYVEEDYEDLSHSWDYLMRVTVFFDLESESVEEGYRYEIIEYKTNGWGDLVSYPNGSSGFIAEFHSFEKSRFPVKGYRKVGVKIIPKKNIKSFRFWLHRFYKSGSFDPAPIIGDISYDFVENRPVEVFYDFDTKLLTLKEVEE